MPENIPEKKFPKNKRIAATLLTVFAILTSCALLMFAIVVVMFAPDAGSEKYFADDSHYQTFKFKILEVTFYENSITFLAEHTNSDFGNSMMISGKNAHIAYENGAKDVLAENIYVTVTVAPKFVGTSWAYTIVGLEYGQTELLPFELGKQNVVEQLTVQSQGINKALMVTGIALGVTAPFLIATIIVVKKKKIF